MTPVLVALALLTSVGIVLAVLGVASLTIGAVVWRSERDDLGVPLVQTGPTGTRLCDHCGRPAAIEARDFASCRVCMEAAATAAMTHQVDGVA
jgi:hypothetical protein